MSLKRKLRGVASLLVSIIIASQTATIAQQSTDSSSIVARPYFTEPALSTDRKEIAFVSGGDIWTVPSIGGTAALLVSHSATEARPLYSPDGRQLLSSRHAPETATSTF
jgi:tricorn protease-like protein